MDVLNNLLITLTDKNGFWPWISTKDSSDFSVFFRFNKLEIAWYAIIILTGMVLCLFRCRYELKKHGLPEDYYDNFFYSVIPISLVGTRLWYVLSNLDEFHSFWDVIGYTPGSGFHLQGLAVQGGVLFGVIWGCIYFTCIKKRYPLAFHFDLIVPTVLIGQILGRWGNFFNGEVYGQEVSRSSLWWIPSFIIDNCTGTGSASQVGKDMVNIPLFFVESVINIVGFVLIAYIIWRYWKSYRKPFMVGALYFIWYGAVRLSLEPLRTTEFIMGASKGFRTSIFMSIMYIGIGVALIVYSAIRYKKVPFERIYVNEAAERIELEAKQKHDEELQRKIEEKKAEIRARKAKEKESEQQNGKV